MISSKPGSKKQTDDVLKELWSVKDATANSYATVGEYLSHLRELASGKSRRGLGRKPSRRHESASRRQSVR